MSISVALLKHVIGQYIINMKARRVCLYSFCRMESGYHFEMHRSCSQYGVPLFRINLKLCIDFHPFKLLVLIQEHIRE